MWITGEPPRGISLLARYALRLWKPSGFHKPSSAMWKNAFSTPFLFDPLGNE